MGILTSDSFEVVYYSFPVPTNPQSISLLGILFDKVLLPGVYLPPKINKKAIQEQLKFLIERFDPQDVRSAQREMIATLNFVANYVDLSEIFIPLGKPGYLGILEPETEPIVMELESLIYGPPPSNFTPTPNMGFNQPAGSDQINAPSWISYPANAFVYARKNGLPLLSDSNLLPFPNSDVALPERDAKALASYLMAASFSLVLPRIRELEAEEILEAREKLKDDITTFKAAMLSGVSKYIELLGSNPTQSELEKQAKYIALTVISPKVEELKVKFEDPKSIIGKKIIDFTLEAPELALNFQKPEEMPWAIIKVLSSVTSKFRDGLKQHEEQSKRELESGLSLLLKVERRYRKS